MELVKLAERINRYTYYDNNDRHRAINEFVTEVARVVTEMDQEIEAHRGLRIAAGLIAASLRERESELAQAREDRDKANKYASELQEGNNSSTERWLSAEAALREARLILKALSDSVDDHLNPETGQNVGYMNCGDCRGIVDQAREFLSIPQALEGSEVKEPLINQCPRCEGSGEYSRVPGASKTCAMCDGSGVIPPEAEQPGEDKGATIAEAINSLGFYDLMQEYRHASSLDQRGVVAAFEAVKSWIAALLRQHSGAQQESAWISILSPWLQHTPLCQSNNACVHGGPVINNDAQEGCCRVKAHCDCGLAEAIPAPPTGETAKGEHVNGNVCNRGTCNCGL